MENEFLSSGEAAKILGVTVRQISRLIKEKKIDAERVGRVYAIPRSEIERYKSVRQRPGQTKPRQ